METRYLERFECKGCDYKGEWKYYSDDCSAVTTCPICDHWGLIEREIPLPNPQMPILDQLSIVKPIRLGTTTYGMG